MSCSQTKRLHHCVVGIHVLPPAGNYFLLVTMEQYGILFILQRHQRSLHAQMILEQDFGLEE